LQERIKMLTKHILCYNNFLKIKTSKKLKLRLKNTIINKMLTYASESLTLKMRDRKQLNMFERKLYRRTGGY